MAQKLHLKERGWIYRGGYPDAYFDLGDLRVTHGRFCGANPCKRHLDCFRQSVIFGHTHTPQGLHLSGVKQISGYNSGHMLDINSPAASYMPKVNSWVQGFAVVYVLPNKQFSCQLINFVGKSFFYGGKGYKKRNVSKNCILL